MNSPERNKKTSNEKDLYIGQKIRERRIEIRIKQHDLAKVIGVASQQLYKYEKGIDRVPASRLHDIAQALAVPLSFFYQSNGEDYIRLKDTIREMLEGKTVRISSFNIEFILSKFEIL